MKLGTRSGAYPGMPAEVRFNIVWVSARPDKTVLYGSDLIVKADRWVQTLAARSLSGIY